MAAALPVAQPVGGSRLYDIGAYRLAERNYLEAEVGHLNRPARDSGINRRTMHTAGAPAMRTPPGCPRKNQKNPF
jgi:hypothetical protein